MNLGHGLAQIRVRVDVVMRLGSVNYKELSEHKEWHDVTYQKRLVNVCFYVEREKFYQKSEVDVFFSSQLVRTSSHCNLVDFSRKHFHCYFLPAVDVAVEVAVELFLNSTATGSRTIF